jgi:hypothetical protein
MRGIVILSTQRSGSTMVCDDLDEIYNNFKDMDPLGDWKTGDEFFDKKLENFGYWLDWLYDR